MRLPCTVGLGGNTGIAIVRVSGNTIGGTEPGTRNLISGVADGGIYVTGGTGNVIQGNFVGTNAVGTAAVPNKYGIFVHLASIVIGGTTAGAGNVISGNSLYGVGFYGNEATGALVQGNYIGTDASGTSALGNGTGVQFNGNTTGITIGGTAPAARNIISGNSKGIDVQAGSNIGNVIQGNGMKFSVSPWEFEGFSMAAPGRASA